MFEKYNVSSTSEDSAGSGGEYEVQVRRKEQKGMIFDLLFDGIRG